MLKYIMYTSCNCILNKKILNCLNNSYFQKENIIHNYNEEKYVNFHDVKSQFIKRDLYINNPNNHNNPNNPNNHNVKNNSSQHDFVIVTFDDNRIKLS